jgi:hypothetical protein
VRTNREWTIENKLGGTVNKFLGSYVEVYLKEGDVINGVFYDSDDECVYIQREVDVAIAIPKANVKYYLKPSMNEAEKNNPLYDGGGQTTNEIKVFVDGCHVSSVMHPGPIDKFSDDIMITALNDQRVKDALSGLVQKSAHYDVGELNIFTVVDSKPELQNRPTFAESFNTGAANQFVSPSQMVDQLNSAVKKNKAKK